jgi:protein PhnA
MSETPTCPACASPHTYEDRGLWVCPECAHEWSAAETAAAEAPADSVIRDANGTLLADGDSVIVIKDLKVKGASGTLKSGTKVRNIRLTPDGPDGHNIACKIDGFGAMNLKSEVVRRA